MGRLRSWWRLRRAHLDQLTRQRDNAQVDARAARDHAETLEAELDAQQWLNQDLTARHEKATVHIARLRRALACTGCGGWQGRALQAEATARRLDAALAQETATLVLAEAELAETRRVLSSRVLAQVGGVPESDEAEAARHADVERRGGR